MKMRRWLLLLAAFTLFVAACGDDDDTATDGGDDAAADDSGDDAGGDDAGGGGGSSDITAAWVYIGPPGDAGWTWAHDQGRQAAEAATGATTLKIENIAEGSPEFDAAVRDFIENEDADIIFATSFGYMDAMASLADEFPEVVFEHVSGFMQNDSNFGNYFGRIYEPRYLSGMAAASVSESGNIGYVAAFPIPEVIRGINAFTLGARAVNPEATVEVVWTSTWFDPPVEGNAAQALIDNGADVIAMHQDSTAAGTTAQAAGVRWVSYNSDMSEFAPEAFVTAPVWDWGPRYIDIIEKVAAGTYAPDAYWGGLADGIVDLAPLADDVAADVAGQIDEVKASMVDGSFHPFTGPINGQDGSEVVADGATPSDGDLLGMSYFVEGVIGTIPEG